MRFDHSSKGLRPATFWNNVKSPLSRTMTPVHEHEFGYGYDIQYKDPFGNVQAELHGLKREEAQYLRTIKRKW